MGENSCGKPANPAAGEIVKARADLLAELTSGDEVRAEGAVPALIALGDVIIPPLRDLLGSPTPDIRWWATRTLAALPSVDPGLLIPLLVDPAPEVRQCAALGLLEHPSEEAIEALITSLSDEDNIVAGLSARALSKIGAPAVERLLQVLSKAPQTARIHAMHALAEIADPRAIPVMMAAMSEESVMLNYWADAGLERMGMNMVYINP